MSGRPIRLALLLAVLAPRITVGQDADVINALAEISTDPLVIMSVDNLRFGVLIPGTPVTLNPRTSLSSGKFEIRGVRRAEFTLDFTLPIELRAGGGPHTIPLSFGANAACGRDLDIQNACSLFDPAVTLTDRIRNRPPPENTYFVWLGGTVSPSPTQFPGVYSAVVTATVQYTGN
jgi:hypothetical protein